MVIIRNVFLWNEDHKSSPGQREVNTSMGKPNSVAGDGRHGLCDGSLMVGVAYN